MAKLDSLPPEIILYIAQCKLSLSLYYFVSLVVRSTSPGNSRLTQNAGVVLNPSAIVNLQLVCKRLLELGRDDALWREQSFLESSFLESLPRRRELLAQGTLGGDAPVRDLTRALAESHGLGEPKQIRIPKEQLGLKTLSNEKIRIRANWDPVFPGEKVNWYDEYIRRHAPISTSWLQQPRNRESPEKEYLEARGVALYTPPGDLDSTMSIAPLDDGSLCLWDIRGIKGRRGAIWQRSKPGILSVDASPQAGPNRRSKMVSTGVTECIAVDSVRNRAYVAVQSSKPHNTQLVVLFTIRSCAHLSMRV